MGKLIHVYGLPRSGTAFVATMLNLHPGCIAHHELLGKTDQFQIIIQRNLSAFDYVADVNTYGWMLKNQRKADIVIKIMRPVDDSVMATYKLTGQEKDAVENLFRKAHKKLDELDAFSISYSDLFSIEALQEIWGACFGQRAFGVMFDTPRMFPTQKVYELIQMKITAFDVPAMVGADVTQRLSEHLDMELMK